MLLEGIELIFWISISNCEALVLGQVWRQPLHYRSFGWACIKYATRQRWDASRGLIASLFTGQPSGEEVYVRAPQTIRVE